VQVGVRDLKNNLSRYVRKLRRGERIAITAHGRVVAELVAPGAYPGGRSSKYAALIADGTIRPAIEDGDPLEGCPHIALPPGTASRLIDEDRGED
jgi:antitoxin (DNA-binding transcriptional repressor) of toxin-antitoxin stability system